MLKPSAGEEKLHDQFSQLQIEDLDPMIFQLERADNQWKEVGKIKNFVGHQKYKELVDLALAVFLIPHSNAACERVFSSVRKIRTDFRSSMKPVYWMLSVL